MLLWTLRLYDRSITPIRASALMMSANIRRQNTHELTLPVYTRPTSHRPLLWHFGLCVLVCVCVRMSCVLDLTHITHTHMSTNINIRHQTQTTREANLAEYSPSKSRRVVLESSPDHRCDRLTLLPLAATTSQPPEYRRISINRFVKTVTFRCRS